MSKLKEIAEKSEGRVIIATLPKQQLTEKGHEVKTTNAQNKQKEKDQDKHQEKPQKSLAEMQADFERLKNLFYKKTRFENAIVRLKDYSENLKKSGDEIEDDNFRLVLGGGYNREDAKITNKAVIAECVNFLIARSSAALDLSLIHI